MNQYRGWPFAKGGEKNLLTATALWVASLLLYLLNRQKFSKFLLALMTPIWLIIVYFFRDPERKTTAAAGTVVAPADGTVVEISKEVETRYLQQELIRVSIFLSLFNVHVQRVPLSGRVTQIDHVPGQFLQAFRPEASDVNEYIAMIIESAYGHILTKQIAGITARRCVNYLSVGDEVQVGERFGMIRFSSRVDLFLPADAELLIREGDAVSAGVTQMAKLADKSG